MNNLLLYNGVGSTWHLLSKGHNIKISAEKIAVDMKGFPFVLNWERILSPLTQVWNTKPLLVTVV